MFRHRNITIEVIDSGLFMATVEGMKISDKTLEGVRSQIDKELSSQAKAKVLKLPAVCIIEDKRHRKVARVVITGLNRQTRAIQWEGSLSGQEISEVLPYTPENEALLSSYLTAQQTVDALEVKIRPIRIGRVGYGRIAAEEYGAHLKWLEDQYAKSLGVSVEIQVPEGETGGIR